MEPGLKRMGFKKWSGSAIPSAMPGGTSDSTAQSSMRSPNREQRQLGIPKEQPRGNAWGEKQLAGASVKQQPGSAGEVLTRSATSKEPW